MPLPHHQKLDRQASVSRLISDTSASAISARAYAQARREVKATWDEHQHPRDRWGRFRDAVAHPPGMRELSYGELDRLLGQWFDFKPEYLEGRREVHPRSGFEVRVGLERRVAQPPENTEGSPVFDVIDNGELAQGGLRWPKKVRQEPIPFVYRGVSEGEWQAIQKRGYMRSDQRGVIADWEGTNAAVDPRDAVSYLPLGGSGHVLKIRLDPADQWFTIHYDSYIRTRRRISRERIEAVSPLIAKDQATRLSIAAKAVSEAWRHELRDPHTGRWTDTPGGGFLAMFDGFEHGGIKVQRAKRSESQGDYARLWLNLRRGESRVGQAVIQIHPPDRQGKRVAELEAISLTQSEQRRGFGAAFYAHLLDGLRERGVDRLELQAVGAGSYAWARAGVRWARDPARECRRTINAARSSSEWLECQRNAPPRLLAEFARRADAGEFSSEAEMAAFGRQASWPGKPRRLEGPRPVTEHPGRMWIGKAVMLASSWSGSLEL